MIHSCLADLHEFQLQKELRYLRRHRRRRQRPQLCGQQERLSDLEGGRVLHIEDLRNIHGQQLQEVVR